MTVFLGELPEKRHRKMALMTCLSLLWTLLGIISYSCHSRVTKAEDLDTKDLQNHPRFSTANAHEPLVSNGRHVDKKRKLVCYYSLPRNGKTESNLPVKKIDSTLCTHIIISKAKIENITIVPLEEGDLKVYAEVVALKKRNPSLRVLLSLGSPFSPLVEDPKGVAIFAYNAHKFLITHGLDGLNLDWEFPAWPPWKKNPKEKALFRYLLLQLNNALKLASHPPLMLTAAVGGSQLIIDNSYEVDLLAECVDFVSVMAYNFHKYEPYMPFTGYNAPLNKSSREEGYLATLNIQWVTLYWMKKGMPKDKLIIGMPTFGRTWKHSGSLILVLQGRWYGI